MNPIASAIFSAISAGVHNALFGENATQLYVELNILLKQKYGENNDLSQSIENLEHQPDSILLKETIEENVMVVRASDDPKILQVAQALMEAIESHREAIKAADSASVSIIGNALDNTIITGDNNEVNQIINNLILPTNIPLTGSAPRLPQLFLGREGALLDLKIRLGILPSGQEPASLQVLTTVHGWPGVGKTTIAAGLAHDPDTMSAFPDGVLWTSLGSEPDLFSHLAIWGRELGTEEIAKAKTLEEASKQLTELLRNKRRLLIVDDAWESEHVVPFKVGGGGCAMLITTRINSVAQALAPSANDIYWLPGLEEGKALELLRELAPTVVAQNPKESLELVRELDGLPLALQVAGRLLNAEAEYGFGVSNLLIELREGAKILEMKAPVDLADLVNETTPTVAALLEKSIQHLNDEKARLCFARLGVFAPNPSSFDLAAMQAVWQMEDPRPIARLLMDRGLLKHMNERNCYEIPALLHQYGQTLLTGEETTDARQNHFTFFQSLSKKYSDLDLNQYDGGKMQGFELLYPDMYQALNNLEKEQDIYELKAKNKQIRQILELIDTLDKYWTLHSYFGIQVKWLKVAYNYADVLNDTLKQADFARRLGRVLTSQGSFEKALEQMEYCKTALGDNKTKEADTIRAKMYIDTVTIRFHQDELETAKLECMRGISLAENVGDLTTFAQGYNSLGAIHLQSGEFASALEVFEKSLNTWEQIGDEYEIARVNDNISIIHYYQGHFAQARDAREKSLVYWKQFPDRIGFAKVLTNLGMVYQCLGEHERAFDMQRQAIEISDRIEVPETQATARNNIAGPCIALGRYEEADAYLNESLQLQMDRGIRGHWVATQCSLAELACEQNFYEQAIELAEKALHLAKDDPFDKGECLRALGRIYYEMGNLEKAKECLETSQDLLYENGYIYEEYLTLQVLVKVYTDLGDINKALETTNKVRTLAIEMGLLSRDA